MSILRDDVRIAIRRLRYRPGFTAIAVLTLALGLGANITIFTLVHALMLRSLPVDRPGELYRIGDNNECCVNSGLPGDTALFSYPMYRHLRDNAPEFSELAAFQAMTARIAVRRSGAGVSESFPAQYVSANYFTMFGVRPAAGRLFTHDDDRPDAAPAVVMSHRAWTQNFGADPTVIGGTFVINGKSMTVVGVAAEAFFGDTVRPDPAALWIPLGQEASLRGVGSLVDRGDQRWLYAIGRLQPGASVPQLESRMTAALQQWLSAQPFFTAENRPNLSQQRIAIVPAGGGVELMRATFGRALDLLFATSGLVLLIACANLANLLLSRADRGQAALQSALGASTGRLMRQAFTEGVLLALVGALAGMLVASAATRALLTLAFSGAFVPIDTSPSLMVWLFGAALAVLTGALFTAAPAWAMSRTHPLEALHGVGRGSGSRSFVPRRSLVVVQVALSMVLLTGAGLLAASLSNLERQPLGFEPANRLVIRIDPPAIAGEIERLTNLYARLMEEVEKIPGVESATYSLASPMSGNNWSSLISIAGRPADASAPSVSSWNRVGPRYFETVGTRVVRGRAIGDRDLPDGHPVAVVNEAFVRRFFERADPIGRRLGIGDASHSGDYEIVGVVEDAKYTGANQPVRPMIFLPAFQTVVYKDAGATNVQARSTLLRELIVRTTAGTASVEGAVRRVVSSVSPDVTVVRVMTLNDQISVNFRINRLMATLTSVYGVLALALASIGLYGVTAYGVARRTREIGIRMALGADRARILRTFLRGPIIQTMIGVALGAPLALASGRALSTLLYGVGGQDPRVLVLAIVVLLLSAVAAAVLPARRAASMDPTKALRTL